MLRQAGEEPHFTPTPSRSPTRSMFTMTGREASDAVSSCNSQRKELISSGGGYDCAEPPLACYLMQVKVKPVYSEAPIPQSCYKKLPRLINGIPLGAGKLTKAQSQNIRWRFVEGTSSFLSVPIYRQDADECRRRLRDSLIQNGRQVFGDVTVKLNIVLTECVKYDEEIFINDIAYSSDEGLHFTD